MEDRISELLFELNSDYLSTIHNEVNKQSERKFRLKMALKKMEFRYIFNMLAVKLNRSRYYDNLSYLDESKNNSSSNIEVDNILKGKKVAVYTCITGNYDSLLEPVYLSNNCDYFVITDNQIPENCIWKRIAPGTLDLSGLNPIEKNRYIKLHPHLIFPDHDYSIYVDGNIRVITDMLPFVFKLGDAFLGVHNHHARDCILTEIRFIKRSGRFKGIDSKLKKQVNAYFVEGYPKHYGLYENPVLLRKHNDLRCINLMESWWAELKKHTMRDQISLPYAIWKSGLEKDQDILTLGNNIMKNPRFRRYEHTGS